MKKLFITGCLLLTSACNLPGPTPTAESPLTQAPLTTPEVAATAPAILPTDTLAAPATVEPPPLYFTEEFDTASPYWEFLQAGGTSAPATSFQNGALHIDISSSDTWLVGIQNTNIYSNIFVRAKTSVNPTGSTGLICRYSEDGWYEFNASNDENYSLLLGQWLSDGVVKYAPIINDASSQLSGSSPVELGFYCLDNFVQLYANGIMIRRIEVTNYGLTEGNIGITASSFGQAPMSGIFEWVQISQQ